MSVERPTRRHAHFCHTSKRCLVRAEVATVFSSCPRLLVREWQRETPYPLVRSQSEDNVQADKGAVAPEQFPSIDREHVGKTREEDSHKTLKQPARSSSCSGQMAYTQGLHAAGYRRLTHEQREDRDRSMLLGRGEAHVSLRVFAHARPSQSRHRRCGPMPESATDAMSIQEPIACSFRPLVTLLNPPCSPRQRCQGRARRSASSVRVNFVPLAPAQGQNRMDVANPTSNRCSLIRLRVVSAHPGGGKREHMLYKMGSAKRQGTGRGPIHSA